MSNAKGWLETIRELMDRLDNVGDDASAHDGIREEIQQQPLSIMVRDGWRMPGQIHNDEGPEEYEILLSTGGPALRIYGQLDRGQPDEWPRLQWQDWGTPWTDYPIGEEREFVRAFADQFYFGE